MRKGMTKVAACFLAGCVFAGGNSLTASAATLSSALPAAGSAVAMKEGNSIDTVKKNRTPVIEVTKEKKTAGKTEKAVSNNKDQDKDGKASEEKKNSTIKGDALFSAGAGSVIHTQEAKEEAALPKAGESAGTSAGQESGNGSQAQPAGKPGTDTSPGQAVDSQSNGTSQSAAPAEDGAVTDDSQGKEESAQNTQDMNSQPAEDAGEQQEETGLAIARVDNYVNVRSGADENSEVVGKLYDKSAGEVIGREGDWYQIQSGDVTGYVKSEFVVTGDAAVELAKQVGNRIAVVHTETLYVRENPDKESPVVGMVPDQDVLTVSEEADGWVKVDIEEGSGYVSTDYVNVSTEFVKAESKVAEEARLAREAQEREKAQEAAEKAEKERQEQKEKEQKEKEQKEQEEKEEQQEAVSDNTVSENQTADEPKKEEAKEEKKQEAAAPASDGGGTGSTVASFATQFVGNPYVYGGTSLTNGTDCSGFIMSVYKNFGISLPHSSGALRSVGYDAGGLGGAQPGDIVCYSGHVGLYIGNGQIVHASTPATGIKISNAGYKPILAVRRIF